MKIRIFLTLILAALLSSCATIREITTVPRYSSAEPGLKANWLGASYAEIVVGNGAPSRVADDGLGGKIYIYEETSTVYNTVTREDVLNSVSSETTAENRREFTEFYVDANDICYNVRSNREVETGRRFSPFRTIFYTGFGAAVVVGIAAAVSFH